ncbi:MAG: CDP-alcohol phosphatidyltransferase family protein [Gammaproteobacteria bacterium]|nr:CDP-alcohol phosphatidyltransferase family protein [Gammaproteobacteria bacterium]
MLDSRLRPLLDAPLRLIARILIPFSVSANQVTLTGFIVGMLAVPLLAYEEYVPALLAILINRVLDGVDGALARLLGATDIGGYLDIVLDFIFYAAVIFGFILGHPESAVFGAFLIFSFIGTGSSFLAYAALAARKNISPNTGGRSIEFIGGITEGTETIILLVCICLFPQHFNLMALIFGSLCWLTTIGRILTAHRLLQP